MDLKRSVGRPKGHKLNQKTKDKISKSKTGSVYTIKHRDNISTGLLRHFEKKYPLSNDLLFIYGENDEARKWIEDNTDEIDQIDDVKTYRQIRNHNRKERCVGNFIEVLSNTEGKIINNKEYYHE